MPLESQAFLVDDVLLKIMCFCDIYHVLGLSQANKRFNSLAFSKEVWLAILSDLNARLFVDIPPGQSLRNFSTGELISLAKRTVEGPRSWAPLTSAHPIVSRKVTVPHNRGMQYSRAVHAPQLLPGGHFVLIQSDNLLECWSLSKKQVIWSYEPTWTQDALNWPVPLAAEVVDDDRVVLMVIPARISAPFIEDRQNSVDVVRLNLITAKSETLVHRRAPDTGHDNPFSFCRIQGDFAIVSPTLEHWVVLLRISTSSYLLLNLPTGCEGYRVRL
ncbi:hypothetical protein FPV67DRAFT_271067 [Lyophyllum atratum]|nr:hypothetical protein FPV67DRAFT_271067 [Lyophyllum atratum]